MPWGDWVNELPTGFFLAVHIAAFAIGATFAWMAFKRELSLLGWQALHMADTLSTGIVAQFPRRFR